MKTLAILVLGYAALGSAIAGMALDRPLTGLITANILACAGAIVAVCKRRNQV